MKRTLLPFRAGVIKKNRTVAAAVAATPQLKTPVLWPGAGTFCQRAGANNRLVIGFIGVGTQGFGAHVRQIKLHARRTTWPLGRCCDVWTKRVEDVKNVHWRRLQRVQELSEMLAPKDIDGVVIATHDPMHARITMDR